MRIGIDCRPLQTVSRYRGIGSYTYNLVKSLLSADAVDRFVLFGFRGRELPPLEGADVELAPVLRELGVDSRWLWESLFLNRIVSRHNLDVYHATQPCCITGLIPCRLVATVHDVIPLAEGGRYAEPVRPGGKMACGRQLGTIRRADRIIAYSRSTADDLVRLLHVRRDRISISPIGCDESFRRVSDPARIEERKAGYGIRGDYILFIGGMERRKNLPRLLRVLPDVRARCGDVRLVIVSWMPESHRRKIRVQAGRLHVGDAVHVLGHIPLPDLVAVMRGARVLALPSFYEGFGLPVLEAMACGTPVLTSNVSSLPEVAGDAALLVDPSSDEEIRNGIIRILTDGELRDGMRAKGMERAALFSWGRHAADVLGVYREIAGTAKDAVPRARGGGET